VLPLHLGFGAAYHGFLSVAVLAGAVALAAGWAVSLASGVPAVRVAAPLAVLLPGGALALAGTPVLFSGTALVLAAAAYLVVPYGAATVVVRGLTRRPVAWAGRAAAVGVGAVLAAGTATDVIADSVVGTGSLFGVRWFVGYLVALADAGVLAGVLVAGAHVAGRRFPQH
jgi:hypothetical protein